MTSLLILSNMQQQQQHKQRILLLLSSVASSSSSAAAAVVVGSTTGRRCCSVLARSNNVYNSSSSSSSSRQQQLQKQCYYSSTTIRYGHTVRVIITKDVKVLVTNNNPDLTSVYASNLFSSNMTSTANNTNENTESIDTTVEDMNNNSFDITNNNINIITTNSNNTDIPTVVMKGKYYVNDVVTVKAGYARNYLFPQKFAVYATKQNFLKYNILDPLVPSSQLELDGTTSTTIAQVNYNNNDDDVDLKAADLLRHYLRNKTIKIKRQIIDQNNTTNVKDINAIQSRNGAFTSRILCELLSKQLKIDLHSHEVIHFASIPLQKQNNLNHTLLSDNDRLLMINNQPEFFPPIPSFLYLPPGSKVRTGTSDSDDDSVGIDTTNTASDTFAATATATNNNDENEQSTTTTSASDDTEIRTITQWKQTAKNLRPGRYLGDYLARITLRGGYTIPLKIEVTKR